MADSSPIAIRSAILGPIAGSLGGMGASGVIFGGLFGGCGDEIILSGILHAGGVVGALVPQRLVPAQVFAAEPRLYSGCIVGLGLNEMPAILQRGEMFLYRAQVAEMGLWVRRAGRRW